MRTLAIGDIHGCSAVLDDLLTAVAPTPADRLVFLGDHVDRGPDSRGVLDRLIVLHQWGNVVCLRGNHEMMMLRSRTDRTAARMWLSVGGTQALGSYGASPGRMGTLADVPAEHWMFLANTCVDWFETDTHLFAHAGVDPHDAMPDQTEEPLFWRFLDAARPPALHISGKPVICGHTSQRSGQILDLETAICLDTNAYAGGWLTCLDVGSRKFWQANLLGQVRTGVL